MCIPPVVEPWRRLIPQIAALDEMRGIGATTLVQPGCGTANRARTLVVQQQRLALAALEPHGHPSEKARRGPQIHSRYQPQLALAQLESLSSALLPVLLALLDACIAGEQSVGLERLAQLDVELEQGAGDAH